MKKLLLLFLLVPILSTSWAQNNESEKTKRSTPSPDFPGAIVFEYGLNYLINPTHEMRTDPWKSATYNIYFTYPVKMGESRFAVIPGIGIGIEKYGFEDNVTLADTLGLSTKMVNIVDLPQFTNVGEIKQTQFIANYVDFPLEFRVHSRKDDHKRSFFLGIGGKVGVNIGAKTKIKYTEFGSRKTAKDLFNYNINTFRYGATARLGYGPFSVWFYYGGNKLFRGNKTLNFENTNMWSFGLSLATF